MAPGTPGAALATDLPDAAETARSETARWGALPLARVAWLAVGLVAGGTLVRLLHWLAPRALIDDEASLALNVVGRSFAGLVEPLNYEQGAPLGFLYLARATTWLLGDGERALRAVPLIAGVLSLPALWALARRLSGERVALFALAIWAFSYRAVEYSVTFKPYALDFLVTCLVLLAATGPLDARRLTRLSVLGAVAIWFSYPVVFVLAAAGLVLAWRPLREGRWVELGRLAGIGTLWVASFLVNFLGFATPLLESDYMQRFWTEAGAFMPLPPRSVGEVEWLRDAYLSLFNSPVGLGYEAIGAVAYPVGLFHLALRSRPGVVLLTVPLLLALAASSLHLYPFSTRLLMFAAPAIVIPVAEALVALVRSRAPVAAVTGWVMTLLLAQPLLTFALRSLSLDVPTPASDRVIARVAARAAPGGGDWVVCNEAAESIYRYYARRHPSLDEVPMVALESSFWDEDMIERAFGIALAGGARRLWVLQAEYDDRPAILAHAETLGERIESHEGPGTSAYLYAVR